MLGHDSSGTPRTGPDDHAVGQRPVAAWWASAQARMRSTVSERRDTRGVHSQELRPATGLPGSSSQRPLNRPAWMAADVAEGGAEAAAPHRAEFDFEDTSPSWPPDGRPAHDRGSALTSGARRVLRHCRTPAAPAADRPA